MRIAKKSDKNKILELKKKINEEDYLSHAIDKIAQELTNNLIKKD